MKRTRAVVQSLKNFSEAALVAKQTALKKWGPYFNYRDPSGSLNSRLAHDLVAMTSDLTKLAEHMYPEGRPPWAWSLLGETPLMELARKKEHRAQQHFHRMNHHDKVQRKHKRYGPPGPPPER